MVLHSFWGISCICMCCRSLFVLFLLAIVLSVLLRFMDSDLYTPLVSSNSSMLIIKTPTVSVNCRTAIKALFLYLNLCLSVKLDIFSCSCKSI